MADDLFVALKSLVFSVFLVYLKVIRLLKRIRGITLCALYKFTTDVLEVCGVWQEFLV